MPRVTIDLSDDGVTDYLRDLAADRGWTLAQACYIVLHTAAEDRSRNEQRLLREHTGPELLRVAAAVEAACNWPPSPDH